MTALEDLLPRVKQDASIPPYRTPRHAGDRGCVYALEIDYRWDAFERPPGRDLLEAFRMFSGRETGVVDRTPVRNVQDGWSELRLATPPVIAGVDREKQYFYFVFSAPEVQRIVDEFLVLLGIPGR